MAVPTLHNYAKRPSNQRLDLFRNIKVPYDYKKDHETEIHV